MMPLSTQSLFELYDVDETAWLDAMAELIVHGRFEELDYTHLSEFLSDMACRERREVANRLAILIAHLLKWTYQPDKRTGSWRRSIVVQRQALQRLLESRVLRNFGEEVLSDAYSNGLEQASAETDLDDGTFPAECPWTLDRLLSPDLLVD